MLIYQSRESELLFTVFVIVTIFWKSDFQKFQITMDGMGGMDGGREETTLSNFSQAHHFHARLHVHNKKGAIHRGLSTGVCTYEYQ